jgi:alanine dehydrogenase
MPSPPIVLFVCAHGSAKSVVAAAHCRQLAAQRGLDLRVASAGVEPDPAIPPHVVAGLRGDGIEPPNAPPDAFTPAAAERAHRVIAIGCDLDGLALPPGAVERWDDIPAVSDGYEPARRAIVHRLGALLDDLAAAPRVGETLVLTRSDVRRLLAPAECIEAVEWAFRLHAEGRTFGTGLLGAHVAGGGFHTKSAGIARGGRAYFAAKTNANFPDNPRLRRLPTIQGIIALFDAGSGKLLALLDSIEVTSLRTAAATAVAARYLARDDASTVTICGCGEQGRSHLRALAQVRPLRTAFAFDTDGERAARYAADMGEELRLDVRPAGELRPATLASDVVVTCTPARRHFLGTDDVRPGTFVAAVGADSPVKQEIDPALLAASTVVTDLTAQCATIGDLHHAIEARVMRPEDVSAELADVVVGRVRGRRAPDEIIVFDSTGTAIQDVAAAALVYERAVEAGAGVAVGLGA